jgi:murein DD-endopeptidase MepM/ murein hydrolase activator NlpD
VSSTIRALQRAGFRGERLKTAFGIVMRESGGNPQAHNPDRSTGDDSYGLAQINMLGSLGPARRKQFGLRSNQDLLDPNVNARVMFQMSNAGKDFGPWGIGPNAYRQGAGADTIRPFLSRFPGAPPSAGDTRPAATEPSSTGAPAANLPFIIALLNRNRERRGEGPSPLLRLLQARAQEQPEVPEAPPRRPVGKPGGAALRLPMSFKSTHRTANLGWPAIDVMGKPGTTVGSPVDGTVVYFHPEGAQGGGSMLIQGADGRQYWLGHIADGLAPGSKVRRGQVVARIANQSVSAPHVHEAVNR